MHEPSDNPTDARPVDPTDARPVDPTDADPTAADPVPSTADELVAVFDPAGHAIGAAPRGEVYARGLWHGSAGVLVRSTDRTRVYVHRRTDTKSVFPGVHDCLAGGVIDAGEKPAQTARRELAEELGISGVDLTPFGQTRWEGRSGDALVRCHLFGFEAFYDGPIRHQPSEVADGWWWTEDVLRDHLADPSWPFVPDSRALLDEWRARRAGRARTTRG